MDIYQEQGYIRLLPVKHLRILRYIESVVFFFQGGGGACFSLEIHQIPSLKLASWESKGTPAMPPPPKEIRPY